MEITPEELADALRGVAESLRNQEVMNKIGLAAIRIIKSRTRKGIDAEGHPFPAYSERYEEKRLKAGLPTSPDLAFSLYDGMLTAMDHVVARDLKSVEVVFTNEQAERLAGYHTFDGAGKSRVLRPFFLLSGDEVDAIEDLVGQHIEDVLNANFNNTRAPEEGAE